MYYAGLGLSDVANKNIGHPVKFEFQINNHVSNEYVLNTAWGIVRLCPTRQPYMDCNLQPHGLWSLLRVECATKEPHGDHLSQ